jgi:hypothetical protein
MRKTIQSWAWTLTFLLETANGADVLVASERASAVRDRVKVFG